MNGPIDSEDFDWVTAQSACSLTKIFETLKLQVLQDVEIRNKLRPQLAGYKFDMAIKASHFTVFVESNSPHWGVQFSLSEKTIEVRDDRNAVMIEATLTLNDQRECRLKIKGQEHELWQFRRLALEKLFFSF